MKIYKITLKITDENGVRFSHVYVKNNDTIAAIYAAKLKLCNNRLGLKSDNKITDLSKALNKLPGVKVELNKVECYK